MLIAKEKAAPAPPATRPKGRMQMERERSSTVSIRVVAGGFFPTAVSRLPVPHETPSSILHACPPQTPSRTTPRRYRSQSLLPRCTPSLLPIPTFAFTLSLLDRPTTAASSCHTRSGGTAISPSRPRRSGSPVRTTTGSGLSSSRRRSKTQPPLHPGSESIHGLP